MKNAVHIISVMIAELGRDGALRRDGISLKAYIIPRLVCTVIVAIRDSKTFLLRGEKFSGL
jgi:hypothetical protein